jgi:hypothetical protein
VARRLATAAAWRVTVHWGGWSDGLIEGWHQLFRLNSFARPTSPRDAVHLTLREPGGAVALALAGPGASAGDVVLRTSARVLEGEAWALAVRLDLKVPTGRLAEAGGSGGFDAGLALAVSGAFTGWLTGHAQLSLARLSPLASALPLQPNPWQLGAEVGLVASLPGGFALLAESRVLSTLFAPGGRADRRHPLAEPAQLRPPQGPLHPLALGGLHPGRAPGGGLALVLRHQRPGPGAGGLGGAALKVGDFWGPSGSR